MSCGSTSSRTGRFSTRWTRRSSGGPTTTRAHTTPMVSQLRLRSCVGSLAAPGHPSHLRRASCIGCRRRGGHLRGLGGVGAARAQRRDGRAGAHHRARRRVVQPDALLPIAAGAPPPTRCVRVFVSASHVARRTSAGPTARTSAVAAPSPLQASMACSPITASHWLTTQCASSTCWRTRRLRQLRPR